MAATRTKKVKYKLKTGDEVIVISGNSKGAIGRILKLDTASGKAIVDGVNIVVKHKKPSASDPQSKGERLRQEAPIALSKLAYLENGKPTRLGRKLDANGKLKRYSKRTGEFID